MTMKLWHCYGARSVRALWALEEMGFDYEVETMPFPPRFMQKEFLDVNVLGTIPYFTDGDTHMTESCAIPHYLVERYGRYDFGLKPDHAEFGEYLNWMYHADATLTFPQTLVLRYGMFERDKGLQQAADDYGKWFIARLAKLDAHLKTRDYLVDGRFTTADINVAYALQLGHVIGLSKDYSPQVMEYLARMSARPAYLKIMEIDKHLNPISKG